MFSLAVALFVRVSAKNMLVSLVGLLVDSNLLLYAALKLITKRAVRGFGQIDVVWEGHGTYQVGVRDPNCSSFNSHHRPPLGRCGRTPEQ